MSLLSVTVKKARYVGVQATQFNTYVTLKLQNVKSTTVTVKGPTPCWEQDFLFEINDINLGLLVEVWNKGVIWDRALGYHYLPLTSVAYNEQECGGRWVELEAQLMMRGGAVVGTTGPTGHAMLLDCRFEPPFDAEGTGGADLQRKLDLLNGALDAERAEQARRQMQYIAHSGYSEDSDYTSDLNYPVGQHPNCSASQFRSAAHQMHTPQRSLEVSRENSYEREEYHMHGDSDPLYYNSQPRSNRLETWSQLHAQASVESAVSWRTAADWQSGEEQRRPSLERQNTLYDDGMGYGYDAYNTTHIRDHSHQMCQQASYEEYFDSTSHPYQTTYVGDDSRQWDSGGMYFYEDGCGMTPTEFEHIVSKRRSSIVQLPQVPPKQLPASSRFSDFSGMAPYRPRQRRTAASLPVTPSSTPRRTRALPVPPGSETGSARRRLPLPPTHVPYHTTESQKKLPQPRYGYEAYGYQSEYQDTATENYRDTNYSTTYDSDGMQPFFDETPHATPPAAAQKTPWSDSETITQFTYPLTSSDEDTIVNKYVPSTISSYLPQPPVTTQEDTYREKLLPQPPITTQQETFDQSYQQYDTRFEEQKYQTYERQDQYEERDQFFDQHQYQDQSQDLQYNYGDQYREQQKHQFEQPEPQQYQFQQEQAQQYELQQQKQTHHLDQLQAHHFDQQQAHHFEQQARQFEQEQYALQQQQYQQKQQQQQKQAAQPQLQTSLMTGAATLGSLMAGGAKKFGSFLGAAAAAVSAPVSQPPMTVPATTAPISHTSLSLASTTPFTSATSVPISASVPEVSPSVPVSSVTTSAPVSLPRTPSLRRQESIQRPSVRRIRTLPDAPEDLQPSSFDESAYEDEYNKTDYEQSLDRDRTSLDRYRDDDFVHDTIHEDVDEERMMSEEPTPTLQKTASPTRNGSLRKPSLDSYHSQTPSIVDRRTSQSSFHADDKLSVPTSQEESIIDKNKVTFQDDRSKKYHEVPEVSDRFPETEAYDEQGTEYSDDREGYNEQDEAFREDDEKFEDQEPEESYPEEDAVFQEQDVVEEQLDFHPEQPKLTPKQRWHRAYNKIVMQLNVSPFTFTRKEQILLYIL